MVESMATDEFRLTLGVDRVEEGRPSAAGVDTTGNLEVTVDLFDVNAFNMFFDRALFCESIFIGK